MDRLRRLAFASLLVVAAAALHRSGGLSWGGADAPGGTRYKVSPDVLVHVLQPRQPVSPTRVCGWAGSPAIPACALAPGATTAVLGLRLVPWVLVLAIGLCLAGVIPAFASGVGMSRVRTALPGAASGAALSAPFLFAATAPRALQPLAGLDFGVGGTLGTLLVAVAASALAGLAIGSLSSWAPPGWASRVGAGAAGLLPAGAFVSLFPPLGALAFFAAALVVGVAVGRYCEIR
jgi:hypothetical protein